MNEEFKIVANDSAGVDVLNAFRKGSSHPPGDLLRKSEEHENGIRNFPFMKDANDGKELIFPTEKLRDWAIDCMKSDSVQPVPPKNG